MKFFLVLFIFISAALASLDGNQIDSIKVNYKKGLSKFKESLVRRILPRANIFYDIIERSIDYDCAAEHLEKYKLDEKLADIIDNQANYTMNRMKEVFYVFSKPLTMCSSKARPIADTIFDLIMSLGYIVRDFKDEPELAEYTIFLKCANNYAFEKSLINASVYSYMYTEVSSCEELKKRVIDEIKIASGEDSCLEETTYDSFDYLLRTILLTQFQLTPEQHQNESDRFFNGLKKIVNKSGLCGYRDCVEADVLNKMLPFVAFCMNFAANA